MESVSILDSPGMTRDLIKNAENEDFKDMNQIQNLSMKFIFQNSIRRS